MAANPAPAAGIAAEEIDDEICLYRSADAEVLILNRTAGAVWKLCDGHTDRSRIAEMLAATYGERPQLIQTDVDRVVDDLVARGFLDEGPSGGGLG